MASNESLECNEKLITAQMRIRTFESNNFWISSMLRRSELGESTQRALGEHSESRQRADIKRAKGKSGLCSREFRLLFYADLLSRVRYARVRSGIGSLLEIALPWVHFSSIGNQLFVLRSVFRFVEDSSECARNVLAASMAHVSTSAPATTALWSNCAIDNRSHRWSITHQSRCANSRRAMTLSAGIGIESVM